MIVSTMRRSPTRFTVVSTTTAVCATTTNREPETCGICAAARGTRLSRRTQRSAQGTVRERGSRVERTSDALTGKVVKTIYVLREWYGETIDAIEFTDGTMLSLQGSTQIEIDAVSGTVTYPDGSAVRIEH